MSSCHGPGQQSDPPTNSRRDVSPGQKVKPPVPWDSKAAYGRYGGKQIKSSQASSTNSRDITLLPAAVVRQNFARLCHYRFSIDLTFDAKRHLRWRLKRAARDWQ